MKNKLIKAGVVALGASALVFCVFKVKKILKEAKEEQIMEDLEEANKIALEVKESLEEYEEERKVRDQSINEAIAEAQGLYEQMEEAEQQRLMIESQRGPEDYDIDPEKYIDEEVTELRHDPNSVAALEQYKEMRLADIHDVGLKMILRRMFEVPFNPQNQDDETVAMHISEERLEFFGEGSKWIYEKTMAELLLHFADLMDFDLSTGVEQNVRAFIANLKVTTDVKVEELEELMGLLQTHLHTGGIFGNGSFYPTFMQEYWAFTAAELQLEDVVEDDEYED